MHSLNSMTLQALSQLTSIAAKIIAITLTNNLTLIEDQFVFVLMDNMGKDTPKVFQILNRMLCHVSKYNNFSLDALELLENRDFMQNANIFFTQTLDFELELNLFFINTPNVNRELREKLLRILKLYKELFKLLNDAILGFEPMFKATYLEKLNYELNFNDLNS